MKILKKRSHGSNEDEFINYVVDSDQYMNHYARITLSADVVVLSRYIWATPEVMKMPAVLPGFRSHVLVLYMDKIGFWKVRTLLPGMLPNLERISMISAGLSYSRQNFYIDQEFQRYKQDILG